MQVSASSLAGSLNTNGEAAGSFSPKLIHSLANQRRSANDRLIRNLPFEVLLANGRKVPALPFPAADPLSPFSG